MRRTTIAIVVLAGALVASNARWLYAAVDVGHAYSDQESSLRLSNEALSQALAVVKVAANPEATREQVIDAATKSARVPGEPFEKDGFLWVGSLGVRFSDTGHLVEAAPSWSPFP
jgi:hypothetical protein